MGTPKVMELINSYTGEMECKVCGAHHWANLRSGGFYERGSWQCLNGCKLPKKAQPNESDNRADTVKVHATVLPFETKPIRVRATVTKP